MTISSLKPIFENFHMRNVSEMKADIRPAEIFQQLSIYPDRLIGNANGTGQ